MQHNHLETCFSDAVRGGKGAIVIEELVDALKFSAALTGPDARLNGTIADEAAEAGMPGAAPRSLLDQLGVEPQPSCKRTASFAFNNSVSYMTCEPIATLGPSLAMRFLLMLAALAATIGLAVPAHADATDDQFIASLGPDDIHFDDPAKAIAAGKSVCTMAAGGAGGPLEAPPGGGQMRMVNIVLAIHNSNPGLNWTKAANFTRDADQAYCPDVPTDDLNTLNWDSMSQGGTH